MYKHVLEFLMRYENDVLKPREVDVLVDAWNEFLESIFWDEECLHRWEELPYIFSDDPAEGWEEVAYRIGSCVEYGRSPYTYFRVNVNCDNADRFGFKEVFALITTDEKYPEFYNWLIMKGV